MQHYNTPSTPSPQFPILTKKLGISVGLLGAGLYFVGIINILPVVVIAGYILLFEDNAWLKRTAVKAVAVVCFFTILSVIVGLGESLFTFFIGAGSMTSETVFAIIRILSIARITISILQIFFLLMLGFMALNQKSISIRSIDRYFNEPPTGNIGAGGTPYKIFCHSCNSPVDSHLSFCNHCGANLKNPPVTAKPQASGPSTPMPTLCSSCGYALAIDKPFCVNCGHKATP